MERLSEVKPEAKVVVKKIEGGTETKRVLEDLGVREGVELNIIAVRPRHKHRGPISFEVAGREAIMALGMADKVYVEKEGKTLPLLRIEKGEKGAVKSIEGGKDFKNWLSELGIKEGSEIKFLRHIPDDTLIFKVEDKEIKMGEGQATKFFVESEGKSIQANYLKEGVEAKIVKVIGGVRARKKLEEMEIKEGTKIILTGKEKQAPTPVRGHYIEAKIGEQLITIGHGMAEKIWIEPVK
ncbi:ferrous iron transport protein A [bacterium]|nr:ferrous iron transport protein A [bacterium]